MAGLTSIAMWLLVALSTAGGQDASEVLKRWGELKPGPERAHRVQQDLERASTGDLPALQKAAYDLFLGDMADFRGHSAELVAQAMHGRARATWSMICLSGSLLRTGQGEAAIRSVQEHLDRSRDTLSSNELLAVWDRLGLVARGAGKVDLMLDALGHSLALGSEDALQLLGWQRLVDFEWPQAVRLFGTLLDRAETAGREPAPWALPGWGLSLLDAEAP